MSTCLTPLVTRKGVVMLKLHLFGITTHCNKTENCTIVWWFTVCADFQLNTVKIILFQAVW